MTHTHTPTRKLTDVDNITEQALHIPVTWEFVSLIGRAVVLADGTAQITITDPDVVAVIASSDTREISLTCSRVVNGHLRPA